MTVNIKKTIASISCFVLLIMFLCPTNVYANVVDKYKADQITEAVMKYITITDKNIFVFNEEAAVLNKESDLIIEVGNKMEEYALSIYQYNEGISTYDVIPFYGYYCGPGASGNNFTEKPIDILDSACKSHDECYRDNDAYFVCECDKAMVQRIDEFIGDLEGSVYASALAIRGVIWALTLKC